MAIQQKFHHPVEVSILFTLHICKQARFDTKDYDFFFCMFITKSGRNNYKWFLKMYLRYKSNKFKQNKFWPPLKKKNNYTTNLYASYKCDIPSLCRSTQEIIEDMIQLKFQKIKRTMTTFSAFLHLDSLWTLYAVNVWKRAT